MSQTVVGLFQSNDQAQNAKRELVEEGFAAQNISVIARDGADFNTAGSNGSTTTASTSASAIQSTPTHATNGDEGIGTKISNWFHSLTGSDEHKDEAHYYAEGVSRGGTVLAVTVPNDEADYVADWLRSHGAHNVDENSGGVRVYSHVTERPVDANVRLRDGRSFDDYDEDFRSDFQKNYSSTGATYDRYAPAYQYGYQLGNNPQYVSGDWNDVETRAKSDWATQGSGSSWEDVKQAVRTGWERTKNTVSGNRNQ